MDRSCSATEVVADEVTFVGNKGDTGIVAEPSYEPESSGFEDLSDDDSLPF